EARALEGEAHAAGLEVNRAGLERVAPRGKAHGGVLLGAHDETALRRRAARIPDAQVPLTVRLRVAQVHLDALTVHPDLAHPALLGEQVAPRDREIRDLAGLDRSQLRLGAQQARRNDRDRGQGLVGAQAALDRRAHLVAEALRVLEAVRGEGEAHAGTR